MLRELRLNNLAIIKNLDLEFNEGLISLTGETGAGKSIILDGISLLIGERSNLEMIRTGEESLFAEGVFDLSEVQKEKLNKLGFEIEDDELIISRYFYRNSKSKITVNGMRMTVSKLKELMRNVLDLVGQHEHQYLLNKNYHLGLLDRFLDKNGQELAKEIRNNVSSLKMINKKIEEIETEKFRIMEKKDILEFQSNEIASLGLKENEDNELEEEYKILFNAGKISEKLENSIQRLKEGEYSVINSLGKIKKNLEQLSDISETYSELKEKIENIIYEVDDIGYSLEDMVENVESDDVRLEKVISRIDEINKMKLKYGSTIEEILAFREENEKKLSLIKFENNELADLKKEKEEKAKIYFENSRKLREIRKKVAEKLEKLEKLKADIEAGTLALNDKIDEDVIQSFDAKGITPDGVIPNSSNNPEIAKAVFETPLNKVGIINPNKATIVVFQKTKEVKAEEANFNKLKEEVKKDYINRQVGEYMSKLF